MLHLSTPSFSLGLSLLVLSFSVTLSRSDDIKGYNAFDPRYSKGAPTNDPDNFDDVFPTPTEGSSSQRAAYAAASNCFKKGGGEVPEYYICRSDGDYAGHDEHIYCQTDVALHCLDDLRYNRSRNVYFDCSYSVNKVTCAAPATDDDAHETGNCETKKIQKSGMQLLGQVRNHPEWQGCCPSLAGSLDDFIHSSAYPDALLCLKRANCEKEKVYTDIIAECEERCCVDGKCRYPDSHATLAGALLPAYEQNAEVYTEGGPCAPSTPSAAVGMLRPVTAFVVAAITTAASLALL